MTEKTPRLATFHYDSPSLDWPFANTDESSITALPTEEESQSESDTSSYRYIAADFPAPPPISSPIIRKMTSSPGLWGAVTRDRQTVVSTAPDISCPNLLDAGVYGLHVENGDRLEPDYDGRSVQDGKLRRPRSYHPGGAQRLGQVQHEESMLPRIIRKVASMKSDLDSATVRDPSKTLPKRRSFFGSDNADTNNDGPRRLSHISDTAFSWRERERHRQHASMPPGSFIGLGQFDGRARRASTMDLRPLEFHHLRRENKWCPGDEKSFIDLGQQKTRGKWKKATAARTAQVKSFFVKTCDSVKGLGSKLRRGNT